MLILRSSAAALCAAVVVFATACGGTSDTAPSAPGPAPVASIDISPATFVLVPGGTGHLTATALDASGRALSGRTIAWSTSDAAVARVSTSGDVTAVSAGIAMITAAAETKSATVPITVVGAVDIGIAGAQFTQGAQDALGSIPMVRGGLPAVVNVLLSATRSVNADVPLALRLFDARGTLIWSDTTIARGPLGGTADLSAPSAQFLVRSSLLDSAVAWQVVRDPLHLIPDDSAADDVFPRAGTAPLATVAVPPLTVRFVPVVLASNANSTTQISDALLPQYLQTLRAIYPLGQISAHVGPSFTTSASFGAPPSGGDVAFWSQLVADLDLARLADPAEPTVNWYGVVAPPPGFNYTSYGGFSYMPTSGAATGPHTRTSASVRVGWFDRPTQARDLVAHELGHTFGRLHAPCGGAGSPLDASYPVSGGTLDLPGHDVYSWSVGAAASAATIPASTGDVMGYCFPVWASTYTYRGILSFRQAAVVAARADVAAPARTRVLVIRGTVIDGRSISVQPIFALSARPAIPERGGAYTVIGRARDGSVLFSHAFDPDALDHAPHVRQFTIALPAAGIEDVLDKVEVTGPEGVAALERPASAISGLARISASRVRSDPARVKVSCDDSTTRGVLVFDVASGSIIGIGEAASVGVQSPAGAPISVLCTDGIHTTTSGRVAPN